MSEKLSIQEAGKSRNFSGVGVIETETPEGDSCFWVPESERELETEYVIKNGTYRPQKYGFSDIDVNVFDLSTDLDGYNWKIDIGDIDMPDISLPDFDIDLSLDLDGMPNIEFGIHIITVDDDEIKVVPPGGEEIIIHGPTLTEPIVILDAIEISYDPSTGEWTITALVACTVGDTTYNPGDVIKTWPGTEKVDFVIQAGIALPDLSETIDLDAGFDVSLDVGDTGISIDDMSLDLIGVDLNGDDIKVDIDLGDLSIDVEECPATIKVVHTPNQTKYQDGEAINLDGIVVQAFNSDGTPWSSSSYPDGYIPAHELVPDAKYAEYDKSADLAGMLDGSFLYKKGDGTIESGSIFSHAISPLDESWSGSTGGGSATVDSSGAPFRWYVTMSYGGISMGPFWLPYGDIAFKTIFKPDGSSVFWQYQINGPGGNPISLTAEETKEVTKDAYYFKDDESGQILNLEWTSPCFSALYTYVDLVTTKREDHGGSHSSGKF